MNRLPFYLIIAVLVVLDSLLLTSPNLLGKIGLIIYKFHYLRTFPRALLTVGSVVSVAIIIGESIRFLVRKGMVGRGKGILFLLIMVASCVAIAWKTAHDFSKWTASHTGLRFKYGAYLLPALLMLIFVYALTGLPKARRRP
jgi:hypothetical protein